MRRGVKQQRRATLPLAEGWIGLQEVWGDLDSKRPQLLPRSFFIRNAIDLQSSNKGLNRRGPQVKPNASDQRRRAVGAPLDGMRATTPPALSASGVTTSDVRCIALLDVADYAVFLCLAISSRTLGTSSVGIAMIVPEAFSDAASSSATASSSD